MKPTLKRIIVLLSFFLAGATLYLSVAPLYRSHPEYIAQPMAPRPKPRPWTQRKIQVHNLPVLSISTPHAIPNEPKVSCTVQMFAPKGFEGWNTEKCPASIEIRGGVSTGYPKKSYALELEQPAQLLDMRTDDDWILTSPYIDLSLMRHKLSFDLFRSLSTDGAKRYAVASRFIEVYLNGDYRGVYLLMERVDPKLLQFTDLPPDARHLPCIYKAVNHGANFNELGHRGYRQKTPKPKERPYWQPMDDFNRFVLHSNAAEFFHPRTGIASRLDIANAIDFHLLVLVTSNYDGITKNFYFCRDGSPADLLKKRFFFVPWDYDGSFGRNWDGRQMGSEDWLSNNLFNRLLRNEAYRRQFRERWNQLYQGPFSVKAIHALIDKNVESLGAAADRDFKRWQTRGHRDFLPFSEEIAYIELWTEKRLKWLNWRIDGQ